MKWKLIQMNGGTQPAGNRPISATKAYIEFDRKELRFSAPDELSLTFIHS